MSVTTTAVPTAKRRRLCWVLLLLLYVGAAVCGATASRPPESSGVPARPQGPPADDAGQDDSWVVLDADALDLPHCDRCQRDSDQQAYKTKFYICMFAIFAFVLLLVTVAVGHFTWLRDLRRNLEREWKEEVRLMRKKAPAKGRAPVLTAASPNRRRTRSIDASQATSDRHLGVRTPISQSRSSSVCFFTSSEWDSGCDRNLCTDTHHSILCPMNSKIPGLSDPVGFLCSSRTGGSALFTDHEHSSEDFDQLDSADDLPPHQHRPRPSPFSPTSATSVTSLPLFEQTVRTGAHVAPGCADGFHSMPVLQQPQPLRQHLPRRYSSGAAFFDISKLSTI